MSSILAIDRTHHIAKTSSRDRELLVRSAMPLASSHAFCVLPRLIEMWSALEQPWTSSGWGGVGQRARTQDSGSDGADIR
jgi:hypothetical protein